MSKYTIGIDLGTTNTVCCTFQNSFEFIKSKRGIMLPSVLMYKDGKITIGETAKQKSLRNPDNVISSSKTDMGNFDKIWKIEDKEFTPTDVAAEILLEVKNAAQKYFETEEEIDAVITVPAYFSASQSDETEKAAEKAGLKVIQILPEPVAAAIAYGLDEDVKSIFVVDIGGGTFDICLLEVGKDSKGNQKFETKCVDGDSKLGGDDFDKVIEGLCYSALRKEFGIDMSSLSSSGLSDDEYGQAMQKIRQKSEQAKVALSDAEETNIEIANLCSKNGSPINFKLLLTRAEFEKASSSLFNKIKRTITRCIDNNNINVKNIGKVVFVGGSANIPYIKSIVNECLEKDAYADKDLSKLVAMGAALYASQTDTLVSTKLIIEDILSHSLGIEIIGEKFSPIIKKGTKYPTTQTEEYYTTIDFQKSVKINVYEGEDINDLKEDTYYGGFELTNIKQGPAGVPIKVNFEINSNKQLIVTAWDETTGSKKSVTIKKGIKL